MAQELFPYIAMTEYAFYYKVFVFLVEKLGTPGVIVGLYVYHTFKMEQMAKEKKSKGTWVDLHELNATIKTEIERQMNFRETISRIEEKENEILGTIANVVLNNKETLARIEPKINAIKTTYPV